MRIIFAGCFLIAVIVAIWLPSFAQAPPAFNTIADFYESVFDRVFPWPKDTGATAVTIVMRFKPSFHPESEIVMHFGGQNVTGEYIRSRNTLSKVIDQPNVTATTDTDTLVKLLGIERRSRSIDDRVSQRWLDEFWKSIASSPEFIKKSAGKVQLDGTKYELRVSTGLSTWTVSIQDSEIEEGVTGDVPIVRWMNSVRTTLDRDLREEPRK